MSTFFLLLLRAKRASTVFFFFSPSTKFPRKMLCPVTRVLKVALPTFDGSRIYLLSNCVRHPNLEIFDIRGAAC